MDIYSKAQQKLSITAYNDMQKEAFRVIPEGNDVVLLSLTGSGKTLAFLLPLLNNINRNQSIPQILIITPTRELALQITSVAQELALGINLTCCYGGHPIRFEKKALSSGPSMIVGTPGRILDHLERGSFDPLTIKYLVLDEFDKTLEMGFHKEMETIVKFLKYKPQYILTSATKALELPPFLPLLNPRSIDFIKNQKVEGLSIMQVHSPEKDKLPTLLNLVNDVGNDSTFIFVNFRESVERISTQLSKAGIQNDMFHGGLDQVQRETVLSKFRNGTTRILVTTDLAGRGLDIPRVENIIHYHLPIDKETFIHRNGRTARMDAEGKVFVILSNDDKKVDFIDENLEIYQPVPDSKSIKTSSWTTIKINKGKRDKIRKIDVVGFFLKVGGLEKDHLGIIEVKDHFSLAAIHSSSAHRVVKNTDGQKIKGKKTFATII